jgi:hypothetical protein
VPTGIPDLSPLACTPGTPVTAEWLNPVSMFSLAHQRVWDREHRSLDGEHNPPAPQAAGTIFWDGSAYSISGSASNIGRITHIGTGAVLVELAIDAVSEDAWFPVASPQGQDRARAYEPNNGSRGINACEIRIVSRTAVLSEDAPMDATFRFEAYMLARAPGDLGVGDSVGGTPTHDVRARISADGVESAEHRNKLFRFCDWLRGAMEASGHVVDGDGAGTHPLAASPGIIPLGAFLVRYTDEAGAVAWKSGAIGDVTTSNYGDWLYYAVTRGRIRCARWFPRFSDTGGDDLLTPSRARLWSVDGGSHQEGKLEVGVGSALAAGGVSVHSIGVVVYEDA